MDERTKQGLIAKNAKLIDMVIERAKRDFPEDIAIIGLTGSFSTGDFHEKSDLDLIIINDTPRGGEISYCFILEDVGYDIYCTPWETRIEAEASLESPMVSCLVDLKILYCAKQEYMDRFNEYMQRALAALAQPIGKPCLDRAKKDIDSAKQAYANAMLSQQVGAVRYAAGCVLYHGVNAIVSMNNTYIKRGVKRYLEELRQYSYLPDGFEESYMAVIDAKTVDVLQRSSLALLRSIDRLHTEMCEKFLPKPVPTYESLRGTYEELWCNCRNKVIASADANDKNYAFHAALGAQNYLDELAKSVGTPKFDLMQHFHPDDLQALKSKFLRMMDEYRSEYDKVGRTAERFDAFEQLYARFMNL
jgi:predicted nucleotidyltransferase